MKQIVLVLAALLFFGACEKEKHNKADFNIQGTVVDMKTQAPVPDVNLKLFDAMYYEGAYIFWTEIGSDYTNSAGCFQIWYNLYGDAALLTFSGLNPKYKKVRIDGGEIRQLYGGVDNFFMVVQNGENYKIELIEE